MACPEENLYFCFGYEFARQLAREVPAFLARFKAAPAKEFDANGTWHYILTGQLDEATGGFDFAEFVDAPPGFPDHPYLSLKHQITPQSYRPFGEGFPFVAQWEPIREVHFDGHAFHSGDLAEQMNLNPYDFYSLKIDWSYPPSEILRAIQPWLEAKRPSPPRNRRGQNVARYYRRVLKELGGYRLIQALGSVDAAWEYTNQIDLNGDKGLFSQEHEWYTARKRTQQIMAEWQRAFDYLENAATSA